MLTTATVLWGAPIPSLLTQSSKNPLDDSAGLLCGRAIDWISEMESILTP